MNLVVTPTARAEALNQAEYLEDQQAGLGADFLVELDATYQTLIAQPEIAGRLELEPVQLRDVRAWPVRRFRRHLVLYRLRGDDLVVLHVVQGSRNLEKLLSP